VDVVAGQAEIVVDGGFLRGTDVLKAIALGADAVGLGRLQAYGLAAGGEDALVALLELLEEEIVVAMGLLGVTRIGQLDPSFVAAAPPPARAQSPLRSAFPERTHDWADA
jgi:isopentenyl diphosphate isomerase/L-lactate dehydrogenase-like FMN-dependent dehydrogenase